MQWVRAAAFIFVGACVASYTKSALMALPSSDISVADLGLIRVGALVGILLVANDGISSEERFMVLVRRLTLFAGLYAGLGLVQFFTGVNIVDTWQIPGLSAGGNTGIGARAVWCADRGDGHPPLGIRSRAVHDAAVLPDNRHLRPVPVGLPTVVAGCHHNAFLGVVRKQISFHCLGSGFSDPGSVMATSSSPVPGLRDGVGWGRRVCGRPGHGRHHRGNVLRAMIPASCREPTAMTTQSPSCLSVHFSGAVSGRFYGLSNPRQSVFGDSVL